MDARFLRGYVVTYRKVLSVVSLEKWLYVSYGFEAVCNEDY